MKLILCGDICPTEATVPAYEEGNLDKLMGTTLPVIAKSDYAIANLECALTERDTPIRKMGPNLRGKPDYAYVLSDCGFTHMGLSNNHVMDYGLTGLYDTLEAISMSCMYWFGFGANDQDSRKPLYLEKDGQTIAVIAVCEHEYSYALPEQPGSNPFDPFDTMEDIALAKEKADHVIVMYHGGKEQCEYPSPRLRKACRAMVRAGADLVLTQHSHCIGCEEDYRGSKIVYGQGNFNFVGYREDPQWLTGLMLEADFADGVKLTYHPVKVTDTGITLAEGEEKDAILAGYFTRSERLKDDRTWMAEWTAFCESMPNYIDAVRNAFKDIPEGDRTAQIFPHYLDCEAHLDVFQTLYKTWHALKKSDA